MSLRDLLRPSKFRVPSDPRRITTRTQLLNYLASHNGYERYLEIGVRNPRSNFEHVQVRAKEGVDPAAPTTHRVTSDVFFAQLPAHTRFDLVFIDGLHEDHQVARDVDNALRHLSPGGSIVLHDCNPLSELAQAESFIPGIKWNGTVWRAWARLRASRQDLTMCVVDIDHGCGVIRRGAQECFRALPAQLDYAFLGRERRALLNLVSMPQFLALELSSRGASERAPGAELMRASAE